MARRGKGDTHNVVERAIAHCEGSPSLLASRLSTLAGFEITRQRVHGWRLRGVFPRDMIVHVEALTNIPIEELASARPKERDLGNVVNRAIRLLGADATAATLADELTKISGRKITRQMVNGWQASEQFPVDMAPWVHILTRIPVRDLVVPAGRRRKG
jgi:hypothetical protein